MSNRPSSWMRSMTPAWALRSYLSDTRADVGLTEPAIGFRMAREDAERAIELDPNAPAGYLALAWVQINRDWNWEGAELSLSKRQSWNQVALPYCVIAPFFPTRSVD